MDPMRRFDRTRFNFYPLCLSRVEGKGRGVLAENDIPAGEIVGLFPGREVARYPARGSLSLDGWPTVYENQTEVDALLDLLPVSDYAFSLPVLDFDDARRATGYHWRMLDPMADDEAAGNPRESGAEYARLWAASARAPLEHILSAAKEARRLRLPDSYPHMAAFMNSPNPMERANVVFVDPDDWAPLSPTTGREESLHSTHVAAKARASASTAEGRDCVYRPAVKTIRRIYKGEELIVNYNRDVESEGGEAAVDSVVGLDGMSSTQREAYDAACESMARREKSPGHIAPTEKLPDYPVRGSF